jgi:hypothetical protein
MLVYHDPYYVCSANSLLSRIRDQLATLRSNSIDDLRFLLILAGELEQGVADSCEMDRQRFSPDQILLLTDLIAEVFFDVWSSSQTGELADRVGNQRNLARITSLARQVNFKIDPSLRIKIPEGFAFYSLFPEQYCVSARQWEASHFSAASRQVVVVGLRSIGTTLSAVAAAALRSSGWKTRRLTVRPTGPPFNRGMQREVPSLGGIDHAIIVDEGPGMSGSSMAAAAEWVAKAGISDIAFLPGHREGPGTAGSSSVQRWWSNTPLYFSPLGTVRWNSETLLDLLLTKSKNHSSRITHIDDVAAGKWRTWAFPRENQWPAVFKTFERNKFLSGGTYPEILWKFNGLNSFSYNLRPGAKNGFAPFNELSKKEFTLAPIERCNGFIAIPWIRGSRLSKAESRDPAILQHLGRYIAHAAEPGLGSQEAHSAIQRLTEMLYLNVKEALSEELADQAVHSAKFAIEAGVSFTYGDGHLAPYEWVRTKTGKIFKTDNTGHNSDHTLIGKQSVLWDVAGTIIEWDLNERQCEAVARELRTREHQVDRKALGFYERAYAAFRMGFNSLGANQAGGDMAERSRLERASKRYEKKLVALLNQPLS